MIFILLLSLSVVILCVSCVYTRIPAFEIKVENQTSIPDSSLRITNKVRIEGESLLKSLWSNSTRTVEIKKAEQELKLERGEFKTMRLSAYSLIRNKHATGELEFTRSGADEFLMGIEYFSNGRYNDKYAHATNEERSSFKRETLVLKEFNCEIALPDFFIKLLENNPSEKEWLKYKHVLIKIRAYGMLINYSLFTEDEVSDTIRKYVLLPSKAAKKPALIEVSINATSSMPHTDTKLSYDLLTNTIVWNEEGIMHMQKIALNWLVEEQKADMFMQLTSLTDITWSNALATQLLITCSGPPYAIANRPGFATNNHALVKFLLSKGADPDIKDMNGESVIIALALRNSTASVLELIKAGAKTDVSSSGSTLLQWAEQRGNEELVIFLKSMERK